ncbi:MAG: hypothetical protein NTY37_04790 [Methanothrix sp.]|nr:hypothetical protein [Methanothrix sp.]
MRRTVAGNHWKARKMSARKLGPRCPRPAEGRPPTPGPGGEEKLKGEADAGPGGSRGPQATGLLEGPNLVEDEQASSGFRVFAPSREPVSRAKLQRARRSDGCRGGRAEGQEDGGEGAGEAAPVIANLALRADAAPSSPPFVPWQMGRRGPDRCCHSLLLK